MSYRRLSDVLQTLEGIEDIELPMNPEYYQNLHDRIMGAIEKNEAVPPDWFEKPSKVKRSPSWRIPRANQTEAAKEVN